MLDKYYRLLEEEYQKNPLTRSSLFEYGLQKLMTLALTEALKDHGEALVTAAKGSGKYSSRLVWATWALVLAAVVQIFTIFHRGRMMAFYARNR